MANAQDNNIVLNFKYKLLLNRKQHSELLAICESQRILYNAALQHRIGAWEKAKESISLYTQQKELAELRQDIEYSSIPSNLQRWTLSRLDNAYQNFFRRVKTKREKAGFPRFRGKGRWTSFGFLEFSGIRFDGKQLRFKGLTGGLRLHLHRPVPEGKFMSCIFKRDVKGWTILFQIRVSCAPLQTICKQLGIDMGLTTLAALSTGELIPNIRVTKRMAKQLRRKQRALARCIKESNRRKKVKQATTRCQAKIKNIRRTYLHQVSAKLVRENDLIAMEDLNTRALAGGILAKHVNDAAWTTLRNYITYKGAKTGKKIVVVNPRHTSQECPQCGVTAKKTLTQRIHNCACGCVLDRDVAAAQVILKRGGTAPPIPQDKAA